MTLIKSSGADSDSRLYSEFAVAINQSLHTFLVAARANKGRVLPFVKLIAFHWNAARTAKQQVRLSTSLL